MDGWIDRQTDRQTIEGQRNEWTDATVNTSISGLVASIFSTASVIQLSTLTTKGIEKRHETSVQQSIPDEQ